MSRTIVTLYRAAPAPHEPLIPYPRKTPQGWPIPRVTERDLTLPERLPKETLEPPPPTPWTMQDLLQQLMSLRLHPGLKDPEAIAKLDTIIGHAIALSQK